MEKLSIPESYAIIAQNEAPDFYERYKYLFKKPETDKTIIDVFDGKFFPKPEKHKTLESEKQDDEVEKVKNHKILREKTIELAKKTNKEVEKYYIFKNLKGENPIGIKKHPVDKIYICTYKNGEKLMFKVPKNNIKLKSESKIPGKLIIKQDTEVDDNQVVYTITNEKGTLKFEDGKLDFDKKVDEKQYNTKYAFVEILINNNPYIRPYNSREYVLQYVISSLNLVKLDDYPPPNFYAKMPSFYSDIMNNPKLTVEPNLKMKNSSLLLKLVEDEENIRMGRFTGGSTKTGFRISEDVKKEINEIHKKIIKQASAYYIIATEVHRLPTSKPVRLISIFESAITQTGDFGIHLGNETLLKEFRFLYNLEFQTFRNEIRERIIFNKKEI